MADLRHKRETARRTPRTALIAASLAIVATGAAVTIGVAGSDVSQDLVAVDTATMAGSLDKAERGEPLSRGGVDRQAGTTLVRKPTAADLAMRPQAVQAALRTAETKLWSTATLNLWTRPDERAVKTGELEEAKQVVVTGREVAGREEVVVDGESRWVTAGYLEKEKPSPGPSVDAECTNGTSVPSGVSPSITKVHAAVCAGWPSISTYGTFRADSGDHGSGRAVDIMISGATGWEIAEYLRANASAFGISYIIYSQQIWSVERGGEGWRGMSDRGSATANHYDHVHVSVF